MCALQTNLAFAALCQSARTENEREGCPVLSAPGPGFSFQCGASPRGPPYAGRPVCGSFRFYVLMIDDETGVLRHASPSI